MKSQNRFIRKTNVLTLPKTIVFWCVLMILSCFLLSPRSVNGSHLELATVNFNTTSAMPQSISDNNASGVCVNFTVSDLIAGIQSVSVTFGLNHPWIGDLTAILKSPNNARSVKLFEKIDDGADDSNAVGSFTFADSATENFWNTAIDSVAQIPGGHYRTVDLDGNTTSLNTTFIGLHPNLSNGIWQLCLSDEEVFDAGEITFATLEIEVFSPTAANAFVSGRIVDQSGRGISMAIVSLIGATGSETYSATTSAFGNFRLNDIPVGNTYVLSFKHKEYRFEDRTFTLFDDLEGLEIRSVKE